MFINEAWAQAAPAATGAGGIFELVMPMLLIFVVFYFLLIRPQQKKMKEHKAMLQAIKRGDRVVTSGGIFGVVSHVGDDHLMVEIADGVKIKLSREAVSGLTARSSEPVKKGEQQKEGANDR